MFLRLIKKTNGCLILPIMVMSNLAFAQSVELGPRLSQLQKNVLPNAIQMQITKRGQKYFETQFTQVLGNLGFNLSEGYFPEMQFSSDKNLDLNDLEKSYPDEVKIFKQVRGLLSQWLVGFSLNDHRPAFKIGESEYKAQFSRFALIADENLMHSLGKTEGAVLAVEMEIKSLSATAGSVRAWDMNNDFLGQIGLDQFTITSGSKETPVKVRLPFYIRIKSDGSLEFEALKISQNLNNSPVEIKYQKLVVPQVSVTVNGHQFMMNVKELEKTIDQDMPMILSSIRENLGKFAEEQLPQLLNEKGKQALESNLEQIEHIEPAGKDDYDKRPDFVWGLKLQKINLQNSLNVNLSAFVEDTWRDPKNPINPPLPDPKNASRGLPNMNLAQDKYDVAMAIDRALINRIMQLSYNRKNFEKIKNSDGSTLNLRATPTIDYMPAPANTPDTETYVKIHLTVETKPDSMFLKDTIVVAFDVVAKLRQVKDKSGMELLLKSIDANSMQIDPKYLSWLGSIVAGKVREGIRDNLRQITAAWTKTEQLIPGKLELPPAIFGIKLDLVKVEIDPNGFLKMYMNYKNGGLP